jgi:DNA helicase HerA-like ATPase
LTQKRRHNVPTYSLQPDIARQGGDLIVGDSGGRQTDQILLGTLAERGARRRLWLDISGEQVVAIFGKRGTGKSYTLGVLIEGLASGAGETQLAISKTPRGGLVFDIMDIFWSSQIALTESGPAEVQRQHNLMKRSGLTSTPLNIDVWVPGGFENPAVDPSGTLPLYMTPSDLTIDDWAGLFEVDIYAEPRGMLIADIVQFLAADGYTDKASGTKVPPSPSYTFADMIQCIDSSSEIEQSYQALTVRSVRQRLTSFGSLSLFSGPPTNLSALIQPHRVSVLMMARLPDPLKNVVVSTLLRRIMRQRSEASFAQKRLDLTSNLADAERQNLEAVVNNSIPRTWVLMDEAHILAGAGPNSLARDAFIKYAKEGRNYGLSLALATQQPSAIDARLTSQVETLITHQLTSPKDAAVARDSIRSPLPTELNIDGVPCSVDDLLRRMDQGTAVFSCANARNLARLCVFSVRARTTAHGGYEA